jgi:hypothetical protein
VIRDFSKRIIELEKSARKTARTNAKSNWNLVQLGESQKSALPSVRIKNELGNITDSKMVGSFEMTNLPLNIIQAHLASDGNRQYFILHDADGNNKYIVINTTGKGIRIQDEAP